MTLRCGCYDQADDIVFGTQHQCTSKPAMATSNRLDVIDGYLEARLPSPVVEAIYDLARDVHAAKADECDGMDSPVLRDPYDMDDDERRL